MNAIRTVMTIFLAAVLTAAVLGWRWVAVLPPAKLEAARIVLTVAAIGCLAAIMLLWKDKTQSSH